MEFINLSKFNVLLFGLALNQYPIENNSQYPLPSLLNPSLPIQNEVIDLLANFNY